MKDKKLLVFIKKSKSSHRLDKYLFEVEKAVYRAITQLNIEKSNFLNATIYQDSIEMPFKNHRFLYEFDLEKYSDQLFNAVYIYQNLKIQRPSYIKYLSVSTLKSIFYKKSLLIIYAVAVIRNPIIIILTLKQFIIIQFEYLLCLILSRKKVLQHCDLRSVHTDNIIISDGTLLLIDFEYTIQSTNPFYDLSSILLLTKNYITMENEDFRARICLVSRFRKLYYKNFNNWQLNVMIKRTLLESFLLHSNNLGLEECRKTVDKIRQTQQILKKC
jgi:hypothetical protein